MAILTMFRHRFYKNDGTVNAGGKVYTYIAGTTTPVATYTDSGAGTPNANPIILDSKGEADIWVSGQIKVNVLESDNTQVTGWPVDNIGSGVSNNDANARWAGTAAGSANALAISPSPAISAYAVGQSFIFKAGASNNSAATTMAISGLSAIAVQSNGAACSGGEILANNWYQIILSTAGICQISKIGEPTLAELGAATLAGSASQTFSVAAATAAAHATRKDQIGVANSALVATALNAAGSAPIYACRAWVNFNGTGTVAIRASGNVSSITDNGVGDYTVNFTIAMEDANYCVLGSTQGGGIAILPIISPNQNNTQTTSAVPVYTTSASVGTPTDFVSVGIAIFR